MLVPSMLYALMDHPDSHTRDLSSLETVYYGASAINPVRLQEAIDRFGPIFAQYYGQSEAPMVISYLAKEDHVGDDRGSPPAAGPRRSCGPRCSDDDGKPVPVGEPGEICVSGPLLAGGYWNLPDETAETFRDGWMHTGDVAREDEDGFWYIVDRTKDMIVTGGFNVFPREVEDVVAEHPAIAQVGVIGTPHEKFGEAVTAIVVLRDGHELTDDVVAEIQQMVKDAQGLGAGAQAGDRHRRASRSPASASRTRRRCGRSTGPASAPSASRYDALSRDQLATLLPELLLIGRLIDRSGMAWCISAFGREEMTQIAIEEWAGSSPIYTRRMQRALGYAPEVEGQGDVVTIFKGLQLDIGAPPQFMDFRFPVHDDAHGESGSTTPVPSWTSSRWARTSCAACATTSRTRPSTPPPWPPIQAGCGRSTGRRGTPADSHPLRLDDRHRPTPTRR